MFLWPVTVFGFSAGELFLLVDEKKIKRRFISAARGFPCSWMRGACSRGPWCGTVQTPGRDPMTSYCCLNPGPTRPDPVLEFICQNLVELSPNLVVFSNISGLKTHHLFGRLNDFVFWVGLKK